MQIDYPAKQSPAIDVTAFCERWNISDGDLYKALGELRKKGIVVSISSKLNLHFLVLGNNLSIIAVTLGAMMLTRAVAIYSLGFLSNRLTHSDIPFAEQTTLWWGGLRGFVSIALALSIPTLLSGRESIIATVFGAVFFTLLVQVLTIQLLLKQLHLLRDQPIREQYMERVTH